MWQDVVIAVTQSALTVSIVPMLFRGGKPTLWTSIPTGTGLAVIAITVLTLSLWLSAVSAAVASALWFMLAFQKIRSLYENDGSPDNR